LKLDKNKHFEVYHNACYLLADIYIKDIMIEENYDAGNMEPADHHEQPVQAVNSPANLKLSQQVASVDNDKAQADQSTLSTFNLNSLLKKDLMQATLNFGNDGNAPTKSPDSAERVDDCSVKSNSFKSSIAEQAKFSIHYLTQVRNFYLKFSFLMRPSDSDRI
jgi:hypothetical protein